jgi:hypothetical protein
VVSSYIYVEGGGSGRDSKRIDIQCQQAFHKLLDKMGFTGRKPRLVACGGRHAVYGRFVTRHSNGGADYVALWIDSEDALADLEATWAHLKSRDGWDRPDQTEDEQVLFMTTCMETWIVADRATLKDHYANELQESALPPLTNLESRHRHDVQKKLSHATRDCANAYEKDKRAFEVFGKLNPGVLELHLPSFVRVQRILNGRL